MGAIEAVRAAAAAAYGPLRDRFHTRRAELFVRLLRPAPGSRVLDLGGGDGSLMARVCRIVPLEVTVADPEPTRLAAEGHGFSSVAVKPGRPLPFEDGSFDIVFSNSVIEHATTWLAGGGAPPVARWTRRARHAQSMFANEIRRVGATYFVQTPHADFPIDAHTWLPFTNWLPHDQLARLVDITDRVWIKRCGVVDWALLRQRDLRALFPDGDVWTERVLGIPKSIIAYKALASE